MTTKTRWKHMARLALGGLGAIAFSVGAQAQTRNFDIAGGELKAALDAYSAQSDTQLIYKIEDVKGLRTKGLQRSLSAEEALQQLLEGTALTVRRDTSGAMVIVPAAASPREDKSEPRSEGEGSTLKTVVVTASRRREPVREVPMQVGILATEQLDRAGAKTLKDYLGSEAGVDVRSAGGPGMGTLSIRGVSTGSQTTATVGVYIDDVAFGSSSAATNGAQMALDMGLLDLNHIELLRGPQGTLYGASATGGLLKYVTNVPDTTEFSGKVALTGSTTRGGGDNSTLSAVLNVPLKEDVAGLRVSAFSDRAGGSVQGVGPAGGQNIDRGKTEGARASLLLTPSNQLKVRLTGTTQTIRRNGTDYIDYDAATGRPIEGEMQRRLFAREPYDVKIELFSADVEYDFGWARLNSITSDQRVRSTAVTDMSTAFVPLLASVGLNAASTPATVAVNVHKRTQEFRLTSRADKQFEWLGGFYYTQEKSSNHQQVDVYAADGSAGPELLKAAFPVTYRELAFYGNATWKFDNGLSLTGGLRAANNKQHNSQQVEGLLAGGASMREAASKDNSVTSLLTARYALTPNSDIYARAATGYRPGGPNVVLRDPVTGQPTAPATYAPDTVRSTEVGYKADLLDKKLSLEAAAFDIRWKNIQQYMPVNGTSVVVNAGAARVRGAELSSTYRPDRHWTVSGNAAYLDAKLTQDAPGLDAMAGARLPNSAHFSASVNLNYGFDLGGHAAYLGLSQRYVGERNAGYEGSAAMPLYRLPAYSLTDLQAGIDFKRASLALFVRNLFDKQAQLGADNTVRVGGGPTWVSLAQRRTIGATLTVPF